MAIYDPSVCGWAFVLSLCAEAPEERDARVGVARRVRAIPVTVSHVRESAGNGELKCWVLRCGLRFAKSRSGCVA